MQQFLDRNLNRTVNFLSRVGYGTECCASWDVKEQIAISYQNTQEYLLAYESLICEYSKGQHNYILCPCCDHRKIFIRNYNYLLANEKMKNPTGSFVCTASHTANSDPFLMFLRGVVSRDVKILLEVIEALPLFWDALYYLSEITNTFVEVKSPLASYFYMLLKVRKDIDPPGFKVEFIKGIVPPLALLPYKMETQDKNLLAAFYYAYGDNESSIAIFNSILDYTKKSLVVTSDIKYFEIFGLILYLKNDQSLSKLSQLLSSKFPEEFQTLTVSGIFKTSQGQNEEAKNLFKKALRIQNDPDVQCMLAHCYVNLKEKENAIKHFTLGLRCNFKNFRILYTIAQGYYGLGEMNRALWYSRKAVDEKSDGSIWKLMGRIYSKMDDFPSALKCFEKAESMKENDSLLYMAELYKKMRKMNIAASYYEKYVLVGEKNRTVVAKYLTEYFEEVGELDKSNYYRSLITD